MRCGLSVIVLVPQWNAAPVLMATVWSASSVHSGFTRTNISRRLARLAPMASQQRELARNLAKSVVNSLNIMYFCVAAHTYI